MKKLFAIFSLKRRRRITRRHAHICPQIYFDILESYGHTHREGNGDIFILETCTVSGHRIKSFEATWNIDQRIKVMDSLGIGIQILSIWESSGELHPKEQVQGGCKIVESRTGPNFKGIPQRGPLQWVLSGSVQCRMHRIISRPIFSRKRSVGRIS